MKLKQILLKIQMQDVDTVLKHIDAIFSQIKK